MQNYLPLHGKSEIRRVVVGDCKKYLPTKTLSNTRKTRTLAKKDYHAGKDFFQVERTFCLSLILAGVTRLQQVYAGSPLCSFQPCP